MNIYQNNTGCYNYQVDHIDEDMIDIATAEEATIEGTVPFNEIKEV